MSAPGEPWEHDELRRTLGEAVDDLAAPGPDLSLAEARDLLAERLRGRPTRANFRTGDLTVCTLVPMRSVPHRVVALIGLDDGEFPRHPEPDGDDLLLRDPRIGERDPRSEDRQLLLDALLSATEKLLIVYSGRDERTNRRRPPCGPVAELLDVVDATVEPQGKGPTGNGPAREQIVIEHPLQPFDTRNFTPGGLSGRGPWSYDPIFLAGARASVRQAAPGPWLSGPLPPLSEPVVSLDDLVAFVEHPVKAFLRRRLSLYPREVEEDLRAAMPIELSHLDKWAVGDRLLEARLSGLDAGRAEGAERARGLLPPGRLADAVLADVAPGVEALVRAVEGLGLEPGAESLEVHAQLPGGRRIVGTVAGAHPGSLLRCVYSRLAPKHRLASWVRFLAVSVARPDLGTAAVTLGRGPGRQAPNAALLAPLQAGEAARQLSILLDIYDRGMCSPLPMSCGSSAAWAGARLSGHDRDEAFARAAEQWNGGDVVPGEQHDPCHVLVWGPGHPMASLLGERPEPPECAEGWAAGEESRFGRLALRLWSGLLAHERLGPIR